MIDIDKFATAQGLDRQDVIELLHDFLEYTETEDLPGLRSSLEAQDLGEVRRRAHSIRGAALNLSLGMIAAPAEKIEKEAQTLSPEQFQGLVDELEQHLGTLAEFLGKS
jgi:HPt (histidine-containing phosphotransfer) domain-containing protein